MGITQEPSNSDLMDRCRRKIESGERAVWSDARRKMGRANRAIRKHGASEPRRISDQDLEEAIRTGRIPANGVVNNAGGWTITINGVDSLGDGLTVIVELSKDADAPLLIEDFTLPQP